MRFDVLAKLFEAPLLKGDFETLGTGATKDEFVIGGRLTGVHWGAFKMALVEMPGGGGAY